MKEIKLTQGKVALVDDADFEAVNQFKWYAQKAGRRFYARRAMPKPGGGQTWVFLHQFLMPGLGFTDHRNGDGLNCQRYNLRTATKQQNQQAFQRKKEGATSHFRGVNWYNKSQKWQAQIQFNKKKIYLGYFLSEQEAALAYDDAARKYFGEFASPNFIWI